MEALCFEDQPLATGVVDTEAEPKRSGSARLPQNLKSVEEQLILDALNEGRSSRKHVAERLGISERTLRYKIARMREAGVAIPA